MSIEDVTIFLQQPGSSPRFVYGALMLPTVLKYYINLEQSYKIHICMTQATLPGYQLYQFTGTRLPVLTPSSDPKDIVEGMLIFNFDEQQRNSLYEFESGLMCLTSVQVEICQKDTDEMHRLRTVDAGAFTWTKPTYGMTRISDSSWCVREFLQSPFYHHMFQSQNRSSIGVCEWEGQEELPQPHYTHHLPNV
ncbi:uncharacterized protein N7484_004066 [Penicillium longicatenatum]|uniref:uncharacterized protein n=1 Tax=Penicillium longicatenatum TaxID=1561947 RepID=UPI002547845C|nr:uncharacterized protein N7484_004066 [Penicillium longicatenatum]KAJ5650343.1 hypothetical protein N7484_004066 [Penicillium longicatenatum]